MKNHRLIEILLSLALISPAAGAADLADQDRAAAARLAVGTCAACHGSQGTSALPTFPNLAGQTAPYIARQLKDFRSHTRGDPDALAFMWGMAAALNDVQIDALADYYSAQPVHTAAGGDSTLQARGKSIFEHGLAEVKLPACRACHGANAEGASDFPRLAGQHREYILKQLLAFQHNLRDNDVMRPVAGKLSPEDMQALAEYISGL